MDRLEAEFGAAGRAAAETFGGELYVLTFQENRRGGDPVAHTPEGKAVFPDKFRGGLDIMAGDTWLCAVAAKGGSTFFAAPLRRIDGTFLMELTEEQIDRVAEVAVREHRAELAPLLESAIAKEADDAARGRLEALAAENEALQARIHELEELYDEAGERVRDYERSVRDLRQRLDDETDEDTGVVARKTGRASHAEVSSVERIDAETLSSPAFGERRYYGHISPDRTQLFMKAHPNGNLSCDHGMLRIPNLDAVIPFEGTRAFEARYDPRHGGWFVRL